MGAKKTTAKKAKKGKTAKKAKKPAVAKKVAKKTAARRASAPQVKHQIVHWEIQSQTPERLHSFYADVFGWKVDANNPMKYGMVSSGGKDGIDGGIGGSPAPGSRVVVYTSVPDINAALARIGAHGGKTIMPREDLGMVILAIYADPEGNTMGLVEG